MAINRDGCANWRALIPEFGEAVARAYRDAAVNHWRQYKPALRSEGPLSEGTPYSLIFAMAGLEMEAAEDIAFPANLDEAEVRHALRYIAWELNGVPSWLERTYQVFPALVTEAVLQELRWELDNTSSNNSIYYILHDLVYFAPWLHTAVAPAVLEWVEAHPIGNSIDRQYCMHIMASGGTDPDKLATLAKQQIEGAVDPDSIAVWYGLRVDCDPANGIPEFEQWLASLSEEVATRAAQLFITELAGGKGGKRSSHNVGHWRTPEHLKALYIFMHRYVRAKKDIDRAGKGVYSPGLRDDAQEARNRLFDLLSRIPGKSSYSAIKQLIRDHPDPDYRPWMAKHAYQRAEEDSDLEAWTAEQICEFDKSQMLVPASHRQLFDVVMQRLYDLKGWLENGNDSPWRTWKRVGEEIEMRTLIAGWINQQCRNQYTTAQEPELANSQRMDIGVHNPNVTSPVPIELKLLDKGWSGPALCERLRNQLAGDYLREETAGCGVMLLVWQGRKPGRRWAIDGRRVGLDDLGSALKCYWQGIADNYPGVEAIEVVAIDLAKRAVISAT